MIHFLCSAKRQQWQDWAQQLAKLTLVAWSDEYGHYHFPYRDLANETYWKSKMLQGYETQQIYSWVYIAYGVIVGHVALMNKGSYWEMGRMVAFPGAPKGTMTHLVAEAKAFAEEHGITFVVECTQTHTSSQWICLQAGLRFAGISVLDHSEADVSQGDWDVIFLDNSGLPTFEPKQGISANPCGNSVKVLPGHVPRLRAIQQCITTDRGGSLPPRQFHTLAEWVPIIHRIIEQNIYLLA